ncbi:MAG: hypothetical protein QHI48_12280, partial [Bacteroidota bacterium]|nr:hypothetical protein [Bacteroidota bacterium]
MNPARFLRSVCLVLLLCGAGWLAGCSSSDVARVDERRGCCPPGSGRLGAGVNTAADEFAPFVERTDRGFILWFTSSRRLEGKKRTSLPNDIFTSRRSGMFTVHDLCEGWEAARRIEPIDTAFDTWTKGAAIIRGNEMFLAAEQSIDHPGVMRPSASGYNLFLWNMQRREGDRFANPVPLGNVNEPHWWTSQPALSSSGDTLVFASDRPNPDFPQDTSINIWYAVRKGGVWTAPRLVKAVSTPVDDMSPSIDENGNLTFASQWDFATDKRSPSGFDLYFAGPLSAVLEGRGAAPVNMNVLTAQENVAVNTDADEIFPHIVTTEAGRFVFWASNAPGGFGGFDIHACRLPSPRVWLLPVVTCYEKGDLPTKDIHVQGRPMPGERLQVSIDGRTTTVASGEKIRVEVGQTVVFTRLRGADECVNIHCEPVTVRVPFGDTLQLVPIDCDCNPTVEESVLLSDASGIPYFITGYWWPNTTRNFQDFNARYATGELKPAKFIDRNDYDYLCATKVVDEFFERNVYPKIERVAERLGKCTAKNTGLLITIVGYTDACPLRPGSYAGEEVLMAGVRIPSGVSMQSRQLPASNGSGSVDLREGGQQGNVILSMLRAYYTMKTIDREMSEKSESYRRMKSENRVFYSLDGMGIYDSTAWRGPLRPEAVRVRHSCRKTPRPVTYWCNDPLGRRIEIFIKTVTGDPGVVGRPLETDLVQKEEMPSDMVPKPCGCHRAEYAFRDSAEAVFVRAVLAEFIDPVRFSRDSLYLREESDPPGAKRFVLTTGCLESAA